MYGRVKPAKSPGRTPFVAFGVVPMKIGPGEIKSVPYSIVTAITRLTEGNSRRCSGLEINGYELVIGQSGVVASGVHESSVR